MWKKQEVKNGWRKWRNEENRTVSYWHAMMPVRSRVRKFSGWDRNKESDKNIENTVKNYN
jgi:hypothetical protein